MAGDDCADACCAGSSFNSRLDYSTVSSAVSTGLGVVLHPEALVAHRDALCFVGGDSFGDMVMERDTGVVAKINSGGLVARDIHGDVVRQTESFRVDVQSARE